MPNAPTLSAIVLARDEEAHLGACLDSLAWTDELVVVVDDRSCDRTEAIARQRAHRVVVRTFDEFASQRNAGLQVALGDWVFSVDADERASPALAYEIRRKLRTQNPRFTGYRVPIRSHIFGRELRYSGTQNDRPLRLFRRSAGRWQGLVHETVALDGDVGQLDSHLTHITHESMAEFLAKLSHYTDLEARALFESGRRPRPFDLTLRPFTRFLKLYLAKRGLFDGSEGFLFCCMSGVSLLVRNWKLRELAKALEATDEETVRHELSFALTEAGA